jgi:hypothetical protein
MYWEIGEIAAHSMSCTAPPTMGLRTQSGSPSSSASGPDGLITRDDEYFNPAAPDPLQKQEPSRR